MFGDAIPRLVSAPPDVRLDRVNAALDRLQRDFVLNDRWCLQGRRANAARGGREALKKEEQAAALDADRGEPTAKPIYATDRLLTLEETRETYCGGAHPNLEVDDFAFDLGDGAQLAGFNDAKGDLDPSRLGRAFDFADPKKRADFDALWMERLRAAIKAQAAAKADDDAECGQIMLERLDQDGAAIAKRIYPTAKGLAFRIVDFPRAVENACLGGDEGSPNPIVVPYAELRPFLKTDQTLLPVSGPPAGK